MTSCASVSPLKAKQYLPVESGVRPLKMSFLGVYFSPSCCQEDLTFMAEFDCPCSLWCLWRQNEYLGINIIKWIFGDLWGETRSCSHPPECPKPSVISPLVPGSQNPFVPCSTLLSCKELLLCHLSLYEFFSRLDVCGESVTQSAPSQPFDKCFS